MFDWLKRLFKRPRDEVVCEDQTILVRPTRFHSRSDTRRAQQSDNDMPGPDLITANAAWLARVASEEAFWVSVRAEAEKKIGAKLPDKVWNEEAVREKWRQRLNMVKP